VSDIYIYIYIERERERERQKKTSEEDERKGRKRDDKVTLHLAAASALGRGGTAVSEGGEAVRQKRRERQRRWRRKGGKRGNRGKEARGWIFQAAPPWQRSQRIAMATDPETPSGRRTTIASERASLSDGSNNVSSLSLYSRPLLM
jgi:hypothetical protein